MKTPLVPHTLLTRLEALELAVTGRTRSLGRGERRSRARGHSVEFADHRPYVAGDDVRYLDWSLLGRLDRLFVKLYEEDRELPVTLLVDASASMKYGRPEKLDLAVRLAAVLGYVALQGFDRVTLGVFPGGESALPPRPYRGRAAHRRLFQDLSEIQAGGRGHFSGWLSRHASRLQQGGLVFLVSDFLDPEGYREGLKALGSRTVETTLLQVLAPEERDPGMTGELCLVDIESGQATEVTFGPLRRKAYQEAVDRYLEELHEEARRRGMAHHLFLSNEDLEDIVMKSFRRKAIWKP